MNEVKTDGGKNAVPNPDKLIRSIGTDVHDAECWLVREQNKVWDMAAGAALSVATGVLLAWLSRKLLHRLIRRDPGAWKWKILNSLVLPLLLSGVLIACLVFSLPVLRTLPPELHDLDLRLIYAAVALSAAWGVFRMVSVLDQKIRPIAERNDNPLDDLTVSMIGNTLKAAIAVTAVLFIGQNIFELKLTALLASAGIIGLAVALAAKDTVSNFFGTVVIIADCPFRIGDRIETGSVKGIVTRIGMRSSRITNADGSVYSVPNSILTNSMLCKIDRRGSIKYVFDMGLTYDTTPAQMTEACRILHEIMDDFHGPDAPGHAPHVFFSGFGAYSMNIHAVIWFKTGSFEREEILRDELNRTILQRFAQAGLALAFPTQTLLLSGQSSPDK